MKRFKDQLPIAAGLIALSGVLYGLHYLLFHDARHIYVYLIGEMAFLPLEVLLVTVVLEGALGAREKRATLEKMNMVIGAFFSQVGTELLRRFTAMDGKIDDLRPHLLGLNGWKEPDFHAAEATVLAYRGEMGICCADLVELRDFLVGQRGFMLRLLENQNLLEHDAFTDLLWATFHLTEELVSRSDLAATSGPDLEHIRGDAARAYGLLIGQWLAYMDHLRRSYPYIFSLSARLNPFDREARAEID